MQEKKMQILNFFLEMKEYDLLYEEVSEFFHIMLDLLQKMQHYQCLAPDMINLAG